MWSLTHTGADFGMVLHHIFDVWHYAILWTYMLTRLLWYTCDLCAWYYTSCCNQQNCQIHLFAFILVCCQANFWLYSIVHSQCAWHTLPSKIWRCSPVHSNYTWKYTSKYVHTYTPGHALKDSSNSTSSHSPSLLKVSSQKALKYTPKHALKYTCNCTW